MGIDFQQQQQQKVNNFLFEHVSLLSRGFEKGYRERISIRISIRYIVARWIFQNVT